jgi:hypothetical protein
MQLLNQFILQTSKQPADWTEQDIRKYLDYIKAHVAEVNVTKQHVAKGDTNDTNLQKYHRIADPDCSVCGTMVYPVVRNKSA